VALPREELDLRDLEMCCKALERHDPDVVIHLAAVVGGIGANQREPGRFFYQNALIGMNMIEAARRAGVRKFVQVGTVCSYPKYTPVPFQEEAIWDGYPEETNAPYGLAKKSLLTMLQAYRAQYGLNGIYLIPVNLYGPGDDIDLASSHVIPALVRKFLDAVRSRSDLVHIWGTGQASREFLYVDDAVSGIVKAAETYNGSEPVNLGSGREISIRALAEMISSKVGFKGEIRFDASRPDGQPRRMLDVSKAVELFGWRASTTLEQGLDMTIADILGRVA
jgi:GDP-L-fucose synthase